MITRNSLKQIMKYHERVAFNKLKSIFKDVTSIRHDVFYPELDTCIAKLSMRLSFANGQMICCRMDIPDIIYNGSVRVLRKYIINARDHWIDELRSPLTAKRFAVKLKK